MTRTITILLCFLSSTVFGQLDLLETEDMSLVTYDYGHKYVLPHATRCFHSALEFHKKLFDYEPSERITVLIQDFGDYGNAGATAIPKNAISMGLSPFSYSFETSPAGERVFSMMNHELVHVVALDNSSKSDRFYHKLFLGKVDPTNDHPISVFYSALTSPRRYSPRWYHEGIASYVETWMSGGVGLAMGSYDEMVFRTRIHEKAHIYSAQGLESEGVTSDFQGRTNSYLYGTRFMGYLALNYGPKKIIEWVKRKDGSKRFFAKQFKHIFKKSIQEGWDDWLAFERNWQGQNIASIRQNPVTKYTILSDKILGSVSYPHFDEKRNKVYVAVNYPGQVPHLAAIRLDDGSIEKLIDIKGAALFYVSSVIYDKERDIIYYTTDNDAWRDLNSYDLQTKEKKLLQKDFRTGDLAFNKADQSIWGIKHLNGYSTIVQVPLDNDRHPEEGPYSSWKQAHTLAYGEDIFDIDISPDGKLMSAAVSDLKGNQSLLIYDLEKLAQGTVEIDTIFNFEISSPQGFRFTEDGQHLYGSSYYSGVSNVFRVELPSKNIVPITNAITGYFRPIQLNDQDLFAFRFTSDGFSPVLIKNEIAEGIASIDFIGNKAVEKHPVLIEWELPIASEKDMNVDSMTINTGKYKPGKMLNVNYAYPMIIGYKDHFGLGYKMNISDPFKFREIDFEFAYTPKTWTNDLGSPLDSIPQLEDDELFHFSFYGKSGPFTLDASYNGTDFYDLFGPKKTSRKGISGLLNYERTLIWDPPRNLDLNIGIGGFYGLERSPEFQQISVAGFDENFFLHLSGGLSYRYQRNSLGAVDNEKGIKASLYSSIAYSEGEVYPSIVGNLDYGIQLPINHASIWFRTTAGTSFSDVFNPFTRFGFAAFGNNYVDYQPSRRYRSSFSFPGLGYNEDKSIIAQNFAKGMVEFVLPPIRFRKFGSFNLYSNWMQFSLFSSGLITRDPSTVDNKFVNIGAQMDMRIVVLSLLPSTLSVGYARAYDLDGNQNFGEFMISLKLLR